MRPAGGIGMSDEIPPYHTLVEIAEHGLAGPWYDVALQLVCVHIDLAYYVLLPVG